MEDKTYTSVNKSTAWKKILSVVLRDKRYAVGMVSTVILLAFFDLVFPLLNQFAINEYVENQNYGSAKLFIGLYVGFAFVYGTTTFLFVFFANRIRTNTAYHLRKEAIDKLQLLSFSYFDLTPQGWIMARITSDSRRLSSILSWGFIDFSWGIFTMFGILGVLLIKNWQLALIILAILPFMLGITYIIRKKILKEYRNARKHNSAITAAYNETFMGARAIKSLVVEDSFKDEFKIKTDRYRKSAIKAGMFSALFGPTIFVLGYFGVAGTLYAGGLKVLGHTMLISELYLFVDYTIRFFEPVIFVSRVIGDFQQAEASAERIVSLINEEIDIKDSPEVIEKYGTVFNPKKENWENLIGDISFKNVGFKYKTSDKILDEFNLDIKAGQSVALVGHTGSGKSTLVNLICRFYEPTEGQILIDGKDYKERSISWLHDKIGYVLQSPQLFSGTIYDNIRYGNLDASLDDVIKASKLVNLDEYVKHMPEGYNTFIGEGGSKLSIGEKQLISFARAIVADPKILVLDEATSSIDTKTESMIQNAINKVMTNRTSLIVAHRLSTIVNSDLIIVMDQGKIIEKGNHQDLLAKKGYYYELYKTQFMRESEERLIS